MPIDALPSEVLGIIVDFCGLVQPFLVFLGETGDRKASQTCKADDVNFITDLFCNVRLRQIEKVWEIVQILKGNLFYAEGEDRVLENPVHLCDGLVISADLLRTEGWRMAGILPGCPPFSVVETLGREGASENFRLHTGVKASKRKISGYIQG